MVLKNCSRDIEDDSPCDKAKELKSRRIERLLSGGGGMASEDIALMAHLMRRAGFGAGREELEARAARGYEATVEELLNSDAEPVDRHDFYRYHPGFWKPITSPGMGSAAWFHTMLNTKRPLEEKMVLFWHQVFATGQSKIDNWHELINQADMLREL